MSSCSITNDTSPDPEFFARGSLLLNPLHPFLTDLTVSIWMISFTSGVAGGACGSCRCPKVGAPRVAAGWQDLGFHLKTLALTGLSFHICSGGGRMGGHWPLSFVGDNQTQLRGLG